MWRRAVFSNAKIPQGAVDRDAYVVCVLEQLHRALNRRDVFASPSNRWADPRARFLDGPRWEAMRADVLTGLSLSDDVGEHLAQLTRGLDAAWRQMADRLAEGGDEAKVEIVVPEGGGRAKLSVDKLGAVGEPESLTWLKNTTEAMPPRIDLPDLLFEVHSWTGFLDAFKHVSDRPTRMEGLLVSLVALLVSESCNIGLTPVTDPENKALTRSRLSHVDQNYLRADTIAAANAALGLVLNAVVLWTTRTSTPPSTSSAPRATRSGTRTSPGSHRSSTAISTSSAATASPPPTRPEAICGPCATQTRRNWTRTTTAGRSERQSRPGQ